MAVLVGIVYPLLITGIGQAFFHEKANGSLISSDGKMAGSELIGQPFSDPGYFWSRPSATSPFPYNGGASSGSNLGPTNPALLTAIADRIAALRAADPGNTAGRPDRSGDGLRERARPRHQPSRGGISGAAGRPGAGRCPADAVRALVQKYTRGRQLGFLGEPRVNVLELNLALDALHK